MTTKNVRLGESCDTQTSPLPRFRMQLILPSFAITSLILEEVHDRSDAARAQTVLHIISVGILTSTTVTTHPRIANPDRIFRRTHLRPELALPVEMELLHDAVVGRL